MINYRLTGNFFFYYINYILDKYISTGVNLHIKNLTRHNHIEYECVARNSVPPDASRHFKININCK
jgi:hypothetical protein